MARRRRRLVKSRNSSRARLTLSIKSSVLKEIWAVFYLGLAVITFLSLRNSFGLVGQILMDFLRPILGWGIFALPLSFLMSSLLFFFSKRITFPLSRILGIALMMISILSILHLPVPLNDLYLEAQNGNYGGYVGFVSNFLLIGMLKVSYIGAGAIFVTLFLISLLLTFEISIAAILTLLKPEIRLVRRPQSARNDDEEIEEEEEISKDFDKTHVIEQDELPQTEEQGEIVTIRRAQISSETQVPRLQTSINLSQPEEKKTALVGSAKDDDYVWAPPPLDLLSAAVADIGSDDALLKDNAAKIQGKLSQFGIEVAMHEVHVGPTVIQYTLRPHEGIKLSKITALKSDLALALAAKAIRIEAPIPGKSLVGIEVPNDHRSLVHLREILESKEFNETESNLRFPLGRDVSGKPMCGDLASMPHLLVAGATGSGKSVGMNTFLISLLYQNSPYDLKLILIDPKRVEMTGYNGIPHLLTPVITDPEKAAIALRWAVAEMNRRYQLCAENRHRSITDFNNCREKHSEENETEGHERMPNIVIIIDELADLMMAAGKEVEASICRIAQMARAVGIHLVLATQRPSVDVITGLIKANIPARIAFAVSSSIDSRTILDAIGAEDLLGKGDMLYLPGGMSKPVRIQGIYISSKEIERVTNHIKISGAPDYLEDVISPRVAQERVQGIPESSLAEMDDEELYKQAMQVVVESRKASASLLQRRLKVGYARAARLLDQMEEQGVIGPVNGAKPRDIYV
jgi:S-DNA-T family DNA segregation ATPase FtsK/SpoIIIE